MLSSDELAEGVTFILRLWNPDGLPSQWIETLRGDAAARWFDIYRSCDWEALRAEAPQTFEHSATEADVARVQKAQPRCIFIGTRDVPAAAVASSRTPFVA